MDYDIVLLFGLTELKAAIAWEENVGLSLGFIISLYLRCCQGVEQRSPANIVYNPDTADDDP